MNTILFVEDDPLMSDMYQMMLEKDYQIEILSDGMNAITRAKEWQPDIILLDMMMPKMNGLEVLSALKADQTTVSIPVVMLSNLDNDQSVKQALQQGAVGYILKSEYTGHKIRTMIEDILAHARQESA